MAILRYGATVQRVVVPDRYGQLANIALGFAEVGDYASHSGHYFGATVGRYANRIGRGRFVLDGVTHELERNEGGNCLHGGSRGFATRVWDVVEASDDGVRLAYTSADGEMGFPGELEASVVYHLDGAALRIDYEAVTSAATVVNLTNHTCWNLAGEGSGSVDGHVLTLHASATTLVGPDLVPTGEIAAVVGTQLDFLTATPIGARGCGYDHNFVLDAGGDGIEVAARLTEPRCGRTLEVLTTEPGLQLYTGAFLDGTLVGPSGRPYRPGECVALETQHFPDSPNRPEFPSTVLRPGEIFRSTTVFRFGVH